MTPMAMRLARRKGHELVHRIMEVREDGRERFYLKNSKTDRVESFWKAFAPTDNDFRTVNGIVEVPYATLAKVELKKDLPDHPHAQDLRRLSGNKVPRFYQMAPLFNYGYIPQTWDSNRLGVFQQKGLQGDQDPIDIVELSNRPVLTRLPIEMEVLGALGLVDQGELDWKILCLDSAEARKLGVYTLADAQARFPERLNYVWDFFRVYKTLEGKPENVYLENGRFFDEAEARQIVRDSHREFQDLLTLAELRETAVGFNLL